MQYTIEEKAYIWLDSFSFLTYVEKLKINAVCKGALNAFKNIGKYEQQIISIIGENGYKQMLFFKDFEKLLQEYQNQGVKCVVYDSENYPEQLSALENPPLVLYCKGNLKLLQENKRLAIVGSRKTAPNILKLTQEFSQKLSEKFIIVTGIADGANTSAILGALESGNIISVQATGFNHVYPACNRQLFDKICQNGLAVSEYPPSVTAQKYYFPVRNRIIAALSDGVLVVSGNLKSGARHTAKTAFDLGREIFAFPYSKGVEQGQICNNIIKEGGKLVENLVDITTTFGINLTEKEKITLTELESQILKIIKNGQTHVSKIAELTNKKTYELQATLMTMQIKGVIVDLGGNNFGAVK